MIKVTTLVPWFLFSIVLFSIGQLDQVFYITFQLIKLLCFPLDNASREPQLAGDVVRLAVEQARPAQQSQPVHRSAEAVRPSADQEEDSEDPDASAHHHPTTYSICSAVGSRRRSLPMESREPQHLPKWLDHQ